MNYLLDTNVISELMRPKPNAEVVYWFQQIPNENFYLSVLTLGEIRKGVESITNQKRKEQIRIWLEVELPQWFENRIMSLDILVADRWGRLQAEIKHSLPAIDSLLAATALHYDLRLVTRNVDDFKIPSLEVINPWNF